MRAGGVVYNLTRPLRVKQLGHKCARAQDGARPLLALPGAEGKASPSPSTATGPTSQGTQNIPGPKAKLCFSHQKEACTGEHGNGSTDVHTTVIRVTGPSVSTLLSLPSPEASTPN